MVSPDLSEINFRLLDVFDNYKNYEKGALLQYHKSKNNFSYQNMLETLSLLTDNYIPEFVYLYL